MFYSPAINQIEFYNKSVKHYSTKILVLKQIILKQIIKIYSTLLPANTQ